MTGIVTLAIIALITYAAWRERAQIADAWTLFLQELGL